MHPLLQRQLKRYLIVPGLDLATIAPFLDAINAAYNAYDSDRLLLEHSLDVASSELVERNRELEERFHQLEQSRSELTHAVATLDSTLDSSAEALLLFDKDGALLQANRRACDLLAIELEWLQQHSQIELCQRLGKQMSAPQAFLQTCGQADSTQERQLECVMRNHARLLFELRPYRVADEQLGQVWTIRDTTELFRTQENAHFLAYNDALTALPNRIALREKLQSLVQQEQPFTLIILDLDAFKSVNESLGHEAGDDLLRLATRRLQICVRENAFLARISADEFAVVSAENHQPESAQVLAHALQTALRQPLSLRNKTLQLSACMGIAIYPNDSDDINLLLRDAEIALLAAKEKGRETIQLFAHELAQETLKRLHIEGQLRYALNQKEFTLHYQPKIDLGQERMIGCEALLRWQKANGGFISPVDFIPAAERAGFIRELGQFALEQACQQAQRWRAAGHENFSIAVNLSALQLRDHRIVDEVLRCLAEYKLTCDHIELEITESMLMHDIDAVIALLQEFAGHGLRVAIDDFGTGYSSLSYLSKFPLYALKIDRAFTRDLPHSPDQVAIATAIISLAHNLRMKVIAEGVEDYAALQALRGWRCDVVQGYYYSRPVDAEQISQLLLQQRKLGHFPAPHILE